MTKVFLVIAALYAGQAEPKSHVEPMADFKACAAKVVEIAEFKTKYLEGEFEVLNVQCIEQKGE